MMKRIILIAFCVALGLTSLTAQKFDLSIETRYTDFKSYDKRTLVVEVLEEEGPAINKLNKMLKDEPDVLRNYQNFIKTYNANLKTALSKYWKLTDSIAYKTPKEVQRLKEGRDRNTIILTAVEVGGTEKYITRLAGTAIQLVFYKVDKSVSEPDYKIMLPYAHSRYQAENPLIDYLFTINMAVRNMNYMGEKKSTNDVFDFMQSDAMANCKKMEKKTLMIDEALISQKADSKGIREYFERKKFKIVKERDRAELEKLITDGSAENSYVVLIPYSNYTNPFGREKKTVILCYKVIVDAEDGAILNYMEGKAKATPDVSLLQEKDFKELNDCEF